MIKHTIFIMETLADAMAHRLSFSMFPHSKWTQDHTTSRGIQCDLGTRIISYRCTEHKTIVSLRTVYIISIKNAALS